MRRPAGALLIAAAALAGCGGNEGAAPSGAAPAPSVLRAAIAAFPHPDPLSRDRRPTLFVARQIYEPLTSAVVPPFGEPGPREGLVRGIRSNRRRTVWTARLRNGVRFSDGALFNARAVATNARRWAAQRPRPLPGLVTADAPLVDHVRLFFSGPVRDLPDRLDDPLLGIVSPRALEARRRGEYRFHAAGAAGTGPYLVERRSADSVALVRNPRWWGNAAGLGPALPRIEFTIERDPALRFGLLDTGQVQIADELGATEGVERREMRADPLLETIEVPRSVVGIERSVRGIPSSARGTPLSSVWLTRVGRLGSSP